MRRFLQRRCEALLVCLASMFVIGMAHAQTVGTAPPQNEPRLALVIANTQYRSWDRLKNPQGDGQLIAERLGQARFDVKLVEDADLVGMRSALRDFTGRVRQAGSEAVALIYYAGHGAQDVKSRNYLIAVDAPIENFEDQAIRLDVMQELLDEARPKLSIIILDACRNNPVPVATRGGGKRGLAVEKFTPGFFIAYSTAPGEVAEDGEPGANSPYATALADEIINPASSFQEAFRKAGRRVMASTNQKQIPWTSSSPTAEFAFIAPSVAPPTPLPKVDAASAQTTPSSPSTQQRSSANEAIAALDPDIEFQRAIISDTIEDYEKLLQRFPKHSQREAIVKLIGRKHEDKLWQQYNSAGNDSERLALLDRLIMINGTYAETGRERRSELLKKLNPPVSHPQQQAAVMPYIPPPVVTPPPLGPQLVGVMNGGRWAMRTSANCSNPAEWFWMSSSGGTVMWQKGQGRAFPERIVSSSPSSFGTVASDGVAWTYTMIDRTQVSVAANNGKRFTLLRCGG